MSDDLVQRVKLASIQTMLANEGKSPDDVFDAIARAIIPLVVERCAKVAENPGFVEARDTEWDDGFNYGKRIIAAAIRNLKDEG